MPNVGTMVVAHTGEFVILLIFSSSSKVADNVSGYLALLGCVVVWLILMP